MLFGNNNWALPTENFAILENIAELNDEEKNINHTREGEGLETTKSG